MKLPKLDDLIGEQMDVYEFDPDKHLFVAGPPGSGKTSLLVARAKMLVTTGRNVLVVTRNRMLASLAEQLGSFSFPTSTMHSFVASDYSSAIGGLVPSSAPFRYDWHAILNAYAAQNITAKFDHVLIDEGQNLPAPFFAWVVRHRARTVTVFADEDQGTDDQRSTLQEICNAGLPAPIRLTTNHRNTEEISLVAEHFHRSAILPPGVVVRGRNGEIPQLLALSSWDELASRVATRFQNRGTSIGLIVWRKSDAVRLVAMLKTKLPSTARVESYTSDTPKHLVPTIHTITPGITVLTGESVIGLEFDEVYLHDLERSLPCTSHTDYRRMYMLCARARDSLFLLDGPDNLRADQIAALPDNSVLER